MIVKPQTSLRFVSSIIQSIKLQHELLTFRPDLDADNVNEHLDLFVNSILSSINESIPELLDQLTTESAENMVKTHHDQIDMLVIFELNNRLTLTQKIHSSGQKIQHHLSLSHNPL